MRIGIPNNLATRSPSLVGTALYVYCVIANNVSEGTGTMANYDFTLDGQDAGNYHHDPENVTDYFYNVPGAFLRLASPCLRVTIDSETDWA